MKIDLILQGSIYPYTEDIINYYLDPPIVNNLILSCWDTCPEIKPKRPITVVRSKDPDYPGIGNINRQLVTSLAGVKVCSNNYCAKMRTDQKISHQSLAMMDKFFHKFNTNELVYEGSTGPHSPIFVLGMYTGINSFIGVEKGRLTNVNN